MNFEEIELLSFIYNDKLKIADAVVCLEGDGYARVDESIRLFKEKWAPMVVVTGGLENPPFSIVSEKEAEYLALKGIPEKNIITIKAGMNTYEEAEEVIRLAKEKQWRKIILVTSHFHQTRAYLTFLMAMKRNNIHIEISNNPVRNLPWFEYDTSSSGKNRKERLREEFEKIKQYQEKGHLVSFKEAIEYQQWKEQQI